MGMTFQELKNKPYDEIVIRSGQYGNIRKATAYFELMYNKGQTNKARFIERELNYLKPER